MGRRLIPLALVVAACSGSVAHPPTTAPTMTAPPTTTTIASPSSSVPTTTSPATASPSTTLDHPVEEDIYDHWRGSFLYRDDLQVDVHAPDVRSNHPIAITIHGGGWYGGRLASMGPLADALAARGFVVFNATYRTITRGGSFPSMVEDVACAVAYARSHALDYSSTADHFTLIGHSSGAHLSSLVAFSPATFDRSCDEAGAHVDAWVGLAGPYDTDLFPVLLQPFYGTALAEDPTPWRAGNPHTHVDDIDPGIDLVFVHGDADEIVPVSMSEDLYLAADQAGATATLRIVPGAGHGDVIRPGTVGDLIADLFADH